MRKTISDWLRRSSVCLECRRPEFNPWVGKIPWRRKWQSTPVLLPGKSRRQRSLVGYSPWGCKESDMTERRSVAVCVPGPLVSGSVDSIIGSSQQPSEVNINSPHFTDKVRHRVIKWLLKLTDTGVSGYQTWIL